MTCTPDLGPPDLDATNRRTAKVHRLAAHFETVGR